MSSRDMKPPDTRRELQRPDLSVRGGPDGGRVTAYISDPVTFEWFAEWVRSEQGWTAFMAWVDEKR